MLGFRAVSREEHLEGAPRRLGFAVLTVSDTRTEADDLGGRVAREAWEAAGHETVGHGIVPDEPEAIREAAERWLAEEGLDVLVVTGGTGLSPRDRTPETLAPLFDRPLPGFGELFRQLSFAEVGAAAMLSRASAGAVGRRAVFLLPGSPKAVRLALHRLILPEAGHLVAQLRKSGFRDPA